MPQKAVPRRVRKAESQLAAAGRDPRPEPSPLLIYKKQDDGLHTAKYGRFEGYGGTQEEALNNLLLRMYLTISNVLEGDLRVARPQSEEQMKHNLHLAIFGPQAWCALCRREA
jgi:hypothetical protein